MFLNCAKIIAKNLCLMGIVVFMPSFAPSSNLQEKNDQQVSVLYKEILEKFSEAIARIDEVLKQGHSLKENAMLVLQDKVQIEVGAEEIAHAVHNVQSGSSLSVADVHKLVKEAKQREVQLWEGAKFEANSVISVVNYGIGYVSPLKAKCDTEVEPYIKRGEPKNIDYQGFADMQLLIEKVELRQKHVNTISASFDDKDKRMSSAMAEFKEAFVKRQAAEEVAWEEVAKVAQQISDEERDQAEKFLKSKKLKSVLDIFLAQELHMNPEIRLDAPSIYTNTNSTSSGRLDREGLIGIEVLVDLCGKDMQRKFFNALQASCYQAMGVFFYPDLQHPYVTKKKESWGGKWRAIEQINDLIEVVGHKPHLFKHSIELIWVLSTFMYLDIPTQQENFTPEVRARFLNLSEPEQVKFFSLQQNFAPASSAQIKDIGKIAQSFLDINIGFLVWFVEEMRDQVEKLWRQTGEKKARLVQGIDSRSVEINRLLPVNDSGATKKRLNMKMPNRSEMFEGGLLEGDSSELKQQLGNLSMLTTERDALLDLRDIFDKSCRKPLEDLQAQLNDYCKRDDIEVLSVGSTPFEVYGGHFLRAYQWFGEGLERNSIKETEATRKIVFDKFVSERPESLWVVSEEVFELLKGNFDAVEMPAADQQIVTQRGEVLISPLEKSGEDRQKGTPFDPAMPEGDLSSAFLNVEGGLAIKKTKRAQRLAQTGFPDNQPQQGILLDQLGKGKEKVSVETQPKQKTPSKKRKKKSTQPLDKKEIVTT